MQVRVLKMGMAAMLLAAIVGCKKEEPPKVEAIDPNAELRKTNEDIAKRLAEQKAEVEKKNDAVRSVVESERTAQAQRQSAEAAITVVNDMKSKWETLLAEANKTPNTEIADLLKRMDGVKTEVQSHKGDECTEGARITLLAGVSQGYDAYREFSTATAVTPALQKKVDDSRALLARADAELQACRSR